MNIRILLADDHNLFRYTLKATLDSTEGFEVVGEAADGRSAVKLALALEPSIVVMDISMPKLNGIDATREITKNNQDIGVIGLSMHSDQKQIKEMFKSGARGYLLKDCNIEEFHECIKTVFRGNEYLSPDLALDLASVLKSRSAERLTGEKREDLTDREKEVLRFIADGCTNKQIALKLQIGVKTIDTHRRQIMDKVGVRSVAGLTKFALRTGLTTLDIGEEFCGSNSKVVSKSKGSLSNTDEEELTQREREVLQLIAEGNRNKQIAEELKLSARTVESHRTKIINKLGVRTIAGLTKYAIREGLTNFEF